MGKGKGRPRIYDNAITISLRCERGVMKKFKKATVLSDTTMSAAMRRLIDKYTADFEKKHKLEL